MKTLAGRPLILMRPGEANNRLAARLESAGGEVWRWPAFAIRLPDETELLERRLANLSDVEMVVLPSPSSVAAVAHWVRRWPDHVVLATVGEGTARAIRAAWGEDVRLLYPEGEAERSGSEALWRTWRSPRTRNGDEARESAAGSFRSIGNEACKTERTSVQSDVQRARMFSGAPLTRRRLCPDTFCE